MQDICKLPAPSLTLSDLLNPKASLPPSVLYRAEPHASDGLALQGGLADTSSTKHVTFLLVMLKGRKLYPELLLTSLALLGRRHLPIYRPALLKLVNVADVEHFGVCEPTPTVHCSQAWQGQRMQGQRPAHGHTGMRQTQNSAEYRRPLCSCRWRTLSPSWSATRLCWGTTRATSSTLLLRWGGKKPHILIV